MKQLYPLLIVVLCFTACKQDPDFEEIDLGYDYFPTTSGTYIEYDVDSIHYGITVETTSFQLREVITDDFVDEEGQRAYQLERFKRATASDDWVQTDVWTIKRTNNTAERVEENERFIRLAFPLEEGKTWDGNSFNQRDPWNYLCTSFDEPYSWEGVSFSETVFIEQRTNLNLVDQELAYEVYARNIGMVFKQFTDLTFQDGQIQGVDMEVRYIDHGFAQ